jgi:PadR family transcriptional regulator PadR
LGAGRKEPGDSFYRQKTVVWVDIRPESGAYLGRMATQESNDRILLLQGTLDLLILRTLVFGPQHGQGIARAIRHTSEDSLLVDHGSLYPALQRLEDQGWIKAKWGTSKNNRKARFYNLTAKGRKQLSSETSQWRRLVAAIGRVLGPEEVGG